MMKRVLAMTVAIVRLTIIKKRYLTMKIADADRLIKHFESVVDVKLFTVPQILTIINTFSIVIPDETKMILPRGEAKDVVYTNLARIMSFNSTDSKKHESEVRKND